MLLDLFRFSVVHARKGVARAAFRSEKFVELGVNGFAYHGAQPAV